MSGFDRIPVFIVIQRVMVLSHFLFVSIMPLVLLQMFGGLRRHRTRHLALKFVLRLAEFPNGLAHAAGELG